MEGDKQEQQKLEIRHDWYQTETYVVVTILVRNVKHDDLKLNYTENTLNIHLSSPTTYTLNLQLPHKIIPEKCSYKIMSTKIEVKLCKAEGVQWMNLEKTANRENLKIIPQESSLDSGPPKYPTSNVHHRDWNAIEREIVQELAKEKPAGEEGVNQLFQKIYGEGSDEVKKAMNKSYLESGGTVLSTNWNEISKDKVQIKPPDGMEWKEWNK